MWNAPRPSHRCGRLDDHDLHEWYGPTGLRHDCPGHTVTEGGQLCVECSRPVASCRCAAERAAERGEEWDA